MRILLPFALAASLLVPRLAFACDDDDVEDADEAEAGDDDTEPNARLEAASERLTERLERLTERLDRLGDLDELDELAELAELDDVDELDEVDEPDDADEMSADLDVPELDIYIDYQIDIGL